MRANNCRLKRKNKGPAAAASILKRSREKEREREASGSLPDHYLPYAAAAAMMMMAPRRCVHARLHANETAGIFNAAFHVCI